jgi:hypothetical protein
VREDVPARGEDGEVAVVGGHAQSRRHLGGEAGAGFLVADVARPLRARRAALAEVVHQRRKADARLGGQRGRRL